MAERSEPQIGAASADQRLDSWKAIAAYLGRDVTTVQRWERREGLPVHRHLHDKLGSVYAFRAEIDEWLRQRRPAEVPLEPAGAAIESPSQAVRVDPPGVQNIPTGPAPAAARSRTATWSWLALGVALIAVGALVWRIASQRTAGPLDPLQNAQYRVLSDFEGTESAAAISRDGQYVAFVSDRDGRPDVWLTRVGTGQFYNVTRGRVRELVNPDVRTLGFSPDGAYVTFWARGVQGAANDAIGIWAVPTMGGAPRAYLENVAEYEWDRRAERLVAHSPGRGDPTFIEAAPGRSPRVPVFTAADGRHAHFPTWAHDGRWLYVVLGMVPDSLDIFRMHPDGTGLERLTHHGSRVTHPVFVDARTLLYLQHDGQQAGGTLRALDVETRASQSLARGLERYLSLAASADGRRIVATLANTKRTLWRVPFGERGAAPATKAIPIALPTASGWAPRHARGALLYVTRKGDGHALWSLADGAAGEIWHDANGRIAGGPAVSPDGRKVAITVEQAEQVRTLVMNSDGTGPREVGNGLAVHGDPDWAPDGASLTSGAVLDGAAHVVSMPLTGRPASIVRAFGINPVWSPDGQTVVYSGADIGGQFTLAAASRGGTLVALPPITLRRGARRVRFVQSGAALIVMRGDLRHKELWQIDRVSGAERQLTMLPADFVMRDYDVSPDGREFVIERVQEHSDIVLIELVR
jgi:Tol biopolymer transport system component